MDYMNVYHMQDQPYVTVLYLIPVQIGKSSTALQ